MSGKELEELLTRLNLTKKEAANKFGVTRSNLYLWLSSDKLSASAVQKINNAIHGTSIVIHDNNYTEVPYIPINLYTHYVESIRLSKEPILPNMLILRTLLKDERMTYLTIEMSGENMNDSEKRALLHGDRLLVKDLPPEDWPNNIKSKQYLYCVVTNERFAVYQIIKMDLQKNIITCHSWNKKYIDQEIELKSVLKLFEIQSIVHRDIIF